MKDPKDMTEENTIRIYLGPDPAAALHSAEREVLEACVREQKAFDAVKALPGQLSALTEHTEAVRDRFLKVRRYRALLDGKAEGKEA